MGRRGPRIGVWDDSVPGMRQKVVIRRHGIEMSQYRLEPSSLFPAHTHPEAQFAYLVSGGGVQRVGGIVQHVRSGDAWYIPPNAPHEFETDPRGTVQLINVLISQPGGTSPQAAVARRLLAEAAAQSVSNTRWESPRRARRPRVAAT